MFKRHVAWALGLFLICIFSRQLTALENCGLNSTAQTPPWLPTAGTNKALIIFIQFSDDTFNGECVTDEDTEWAADRDDIPAWAFDVIDTTDTGTHTVASLTDYFCKMSRDRNAGTHGDFHLIGRVYPDLVVPEHTRSWYETTSNHGYDNEWVAVHREILDFVNDNPEGIDLSDFDDYDNGTTTRQADGVFDMVIMAYRQHFGGFSGISNLDGDVFGGTSVDFGSPDIELDGLTINPHFTDGSGVVARAPDHHFFIRVAAHEYVHRILGGGHFNYQGHYGLMDLQTGFTMSAYERELSDWIDPPVITTNSTDVTLTEAITTAGIYKIEIPNTGQNAEYFLLENRQQTFWADSSSLHDGDSCDDELPGTGLMIAHIDPDASKPNQLFWERSDGASPTRLEYRT